MFHVSMKLFYVINNQICYNVPYMVMFEMKKERKASNRERNNFEISIKLNSGLVMIKSFKVITFFSNDSSELVLKVIYYI